MTSPSPTIGGDIARLRRLWKHAATIGVVLAVVCHMLPPDRRALCDAIANICSGGF